MELTTIELIAGLVRYKKERKENSMLRHSVNSIRTASCNAATPVSLSTVVRAATPTLFMVGNKTTTFHSTALTQSIRCCSTSSASINRRSLIEQRIDEINASLLRPNDRFGHVPKLTYSTPMVMLLGNHSSGKSTLINRLLGIEEQETGVAPTDDGFTVLMRGDVKMDMDGPSAVTSPSHQFQDLAQYGPNFVNHFRVKTRPVPAESLFPTDMMIVDTPGMIDTPIHVQDRTTLEGQNRGYDFLAVTRWFAQRCDVILLMFDPANPGTTGETLDVLTKSLSGFEHKFLILLNKVDMFSKVTDFARAYGTLCWNLSKVIRMKDVPRIYTTFTPQLEADGDGGNPAAVTKAGVPLKEMERARREVLEEILKAPLRRLDNLITEMDESVKRVLLAGNVSTVISRRVLARRALVFTSTAAACMTVPVGIGYALACMDPVLMAGTTVVTGAIAAAAVYFGNKNVAAYEKQCIQQLDGVVDELFPGKLLTTEVRQRWERNVKPSLLDHYQGVAPPGGKFSTTLSSRLARKLEHVVADEVPQLREEVLKHKEQLIRTTAQR